MIYLSLIKQFAPVLLGGIGVLLLYLKGRSDGKAKVQLKEAHDEIEELTEIIKIQDSIKSNDGNVDSLIDSLPDHYN